MDDIYYTRKRPSLLKKILIFYLSCLLLDYIFTAYLFQIVQYNAGDSNFLSEYSNTKILSISSPYVIRFFKIFEFTRPSSAHLGDIVLVESTEYKHQFWLKKYGLNFLEIISLGIVKQQKYNVAEVVGTAHQTLHYSAKKIFDSANKESKKKIPYFDTLRTITLAADEVFVISQNEYAIDSRVLGAMKLRDIKGKLYFVLRPYWERIKK